VRDEWDITSKMMAKSERNVLSATVIEIAQQKYWELTEIDVAERVERLRFSPLPAVSVLIVLLPPSVDFPFPMALEMALDATRSRDVLTGSLVRGARGWPNVVQLA
jgi:hypothetical protein